MSLAATGHEVTTEPGHERVRVRFNGTVIADTTRPVILHETGLPTVYYVPREDARMDLLARSTHQTRCPFKGMANYFDIVVDGKRSANTVWTYEDPIAAAAAIKNHLAFYPDRVDIERDAK